MEEASEGGLGSRRAAVVAQITPSGHERSRTSSSSSSTLRTSGPFSGLCTAPKARAVIRLSISWRVLVVSIRSWMEMSAVEKGMGLEEG